MVLPVPPCRYMHLNILIIYFMFKSS